MAQVGGCIVNSDQLTGQVSAEHVLTSERWNCSGIVSSLLHCSSNRYILCKSTV